MARRAILGRRVLAKRRNDADFYAIWYGRFTTRPKGAPQMIQYGVAALEKATILLSCALSWIIWASSELIKTTLTEY